MAEVVEVLERLIGTLRKLEGIGRLLREVEAAASATLTLGEVDLGEVPQLELELEPNRPLRGLLGELLALQGEEGGALLLARLCTTAEEGKRAIELTVAVGESLFDARIYGIRIPGRGQVTARLIDLLALSLLEEDDWRAIAAFLEEREVRLRGVLERLREALAAVKVALT